MDSSWNEFANFLRDMIAKYADEIELDNIKNSSPATSVKNIEKRGQETSKSFAGVSSTN